MIILSCFNHHSLSSVATIRRETTHDLVKWDQMAVPVFFVHCFEDQGGVGIEAF
jgi:hypothetical protein